MTSAHDAHPATSSVAFCERDAIANAANLSALIFDTFADINWAGFYFARGE